MCLHPWWVDSSIIRASLPSGKRKQHSRSRPPRCPRPSQATICRPPAVAKLLTIICQHKLTRFSVCPQGLSALWMFASRSSRRYALSERGPRTRRRQQTSIVRRIRDDHRITGWQRSVSNRHRPRRGVSRDFFSPAGTARPAPRLPRPGVSRGDAAQSGRALLAVPTKRAVARCAHEASRCSLCPRSKPLLAVPTKQPLLAVPKNSLEPDYRRRRRERR